MTVQRNLDLLPSAELHLHIEGTLEPEMVFALAAKNGVTLPYDSVDDLRARYEFDDLPSFLTLYYECMAVLCTREDFCDLAVAYLRRAGAQGVHHAELFFDPQAHTARGIPIDDVIDGLADGLAIARTELGISGGLILCFLRDRGAETALATLESVAARAGDLLGVGLDSAEVGFPPSLFTDVFARAGDLGLHRVAHAGEEGPPSYISEALDLLGAERIDHGVRCLEDPGLVDRLRRERIPLTVCPLSNVRLAVVSTLSEHPLVRMIDAGLLVTLNSDDPAYFGGYLGANLSGVRESLGIEDGTFATLARNSVHASFAEPARKSELLALIDQWWRE